MQTCDSCDDECIGELLKECSGCGCDTCPDCWIEQTEQCEDCWEEDTHNIERIDNNVLNMGTQIDGMAEDMKSMTKAIFFAVVFSCVALSLSITLAMRAWVGTP
jgi:hypothetical protein